MWGVFLSSPFLTLAVILITEYTTKADNSVLTLLLFILIPLYLLIGLVIGVAALIPGLIGARFAKKDLVYEQQYEYPPDYDQSTNY